MDKLHQRNELIWVKGWSNEQGPQRIYQTIERYEPVFNEETEKGFIEDTYTRLKSLKTQKCTGSCC